MLTGSRWTVAASALLLVLIASSPGRAAPPVTSGLEAQFVGDDVVPVAGFVQTWTESFGGVITATQGTPARRPALVDDALNGHDIVRFDGVDDGLTLSANLFSSTSFPKTVFAVVRTADVNGHIVGTGSSQAGFLPSFGSALTVMANNYFYKANSSSTGVALVAPEYDVADDWQVIVATVSSGASRIETLCSIAESSAATNAFNYGVSYLGSTGGGQDPLDGDVAEILVYDRVLSASEIESVRDDLAATYGLSVPGRSDADADGVVDDCDEGLVYLNDSQITITDFSPPAIASLIGNAIDEETPLGSDAHTISTHVYTNAPIALEFDLGASYDLELLHFWNYDNAAGDFDADDVSVSFLDAQGAEVTTLDFSPEVGQNPIYGQDLALSGATGVRTVQVLASGTNGETDFQNIGFTGALSPQVPAIGLVARWLLALVLFLAAGLGLARTKPARS